MLYYALLVLVAVVLALWFVRVSRSMRDNWLGALVPVVGFIVLLILFLGGAAVVGFGARSEVERLFPDPPPYSRVRR